MRTRTRPSTHPHTPSRDERERTIVHLARTRTSQTKRPSSRTFSGRARTHNRTPRAHSHQTKRLSSRTFSGQARAHDCTPRPRAHSHQTKDPSSRTFLLAPVTNMSPRKKKSWPLQRQSSGKENWGSDVNMVPLQIPPRKMTTKPRADNLPRRQPEDI